MWVEAEDAMAVWMWPTKLSRSHHQKRVSSWWQMRCAKYSQFGEMGSEVNKRNTQKKKRHRVDLALVLEVYRGIAVANSEMYMN